MRENEVDFFRRRAAEENDRADRSVDGVAADIHRRMAIAYANRAAEIENSRALNLVQPPMADQDSTSSR
jgi:hypothetical protein